jgi:hypothetical protein
MRRCRGCCLPVPVEIGRRLWAVKIAPVGDRSAGAFQSEQHTESEPFHASMQPNTASAVNAKRGKNDEAGMLNMLASCHGFGFRD